MTVSKSIELHFEVNGMTFAAQEWGDPDGAPVLALHGWLDNSTSFYRLAPLLKNVRLVAIDMAGHGETDRRPGFTPYGIWEDVSEVMGIADQLGWERFSLMGHSRGGVVSSIVAGTFPERIDSVVLLDGFAPEPIPAESAPEQLQKSILEHRAKGTPPMFDSLEKMVKARLAGFWPLSRASVEALLERGVRREAGGYCWTSDPRLMLASPMKLTQDQVAAFIKRNDAPTQLLLAENGLSKAFGRVKPLLQGMSNYQIETLPGEHHFHMEDGCEAIAERVNAFYEATFFQKSVIS